MNLLDIRNAQGALRRALPAVAMGLALVAVPACSIAQDANPPKDAGSKPAPKKPPVGAVILFGGKQAQIDENWTRDNGQPATWVAKKGAMQARDGGIVSKEKFLDCYLHVEFKTPYMPEAKGQGRGNSGVFLQRGYEIQVLDSYGIADPGSGDCGAVYSQSAPLVNATKPPLQWQTYDMIFRAARFDAQGNVTAKPRITVLLNGIVVQNNTEIESRTADKGPFVQGPESIELQFHGNPVQYRNVWVIPLPEQGAQHY